MSCLCEKRYQTLPTYTYLCSGAGNEANVYHLVYLHMFHCVGLIHSFIRRGPPPPTVLWKAKEQGYKFVIKDFPSYLMESPVKCITPCFLIVGPPEITQHPKDQSVATGTDTTFTIVASGDNLQFQWQKDGDDIDSNESRLCSSKPNNSTLRIPFVKKSDKGRYKCLVKNPVKHSGKLSYEAKLEICKFVLCE